MLHYFSWTVYRCQSTDSQAVQASNIPLLQHTSDSSHTAGGDEWGMGADDWGDGCDDWGDCNKNTDNISPEFDDNLDDTNDNVDDSDVNLGDTNLDGMVAIGPAQSQEYKGGNVNIFLQICH